MEFWEILSFLLIWIILPIAGIFAIIFLCIVFYNLIYSVKKTNEILDTVDRNLDKLEEPIDSIVESYEKIKAVSQTLSKTLTSFKIISKVADKTEKRKVKRAKKNREK